MPQLASVSAVGGPVQMLAPKLDQWVGGPVSIDNGKRILTAVQDDREEYLAEVPADGKGSYHRLTEGNGEASSPNEAGGHTALLWTTDTASPEIYALEDTRLRQLTHHNDALVANLILAPTTDLSAKASDGSEVHSLLTMPVGYTPGTKAPMVLFIHGGPTGQDAHGFRPDRQLFAAHGYAMLNVNYRGSTGRGHAYSEAINADWGGRAVATGNIDPERLVVGGWSYGGILTDYTIATTHRFKAASSGAGMGNLLGFYGVDQYILQYENELGPPWKNLDAYIKLSYPFLHADRINTPTLFMGGDKDFNVPIGRRRADVRGPEERRSERRTDRLPRRVPRLQPPQLHPRPLRALVQLVRQIRHAQTRQHGCHTACSGQLGRQAAFLISQHSVILSGAKNLCIRAFRFAEGTRLGRQSRPKRKDRGPSLRFV